MTTTDSLRDRLEADLRQAMRDRDTDTRDTVRLLLSAVKNAEIDKRGPLSADEAIVVLRSQAKQRQDSIEQYRAAGRDDLADREAMELAILERYLPQQMSDDELKAFVMEGIVESGAEGPKDMGKVMGLLTKRADGRVDGRRLSAAVRAELAG
jgi:uncharacterized protein YqeY